MDKKEYIEREALIEEINSLSVTLSGKELFGELAKHSVEQKINEQPTADVVPVVHGEWKQVSEKYPRFVCTHCEGLFNNKGYKYCPNCGAKMDRKKCVPRTEATP